MGATCRQISCKLSTYCEHRSHKITIKASNKRGFFVAQLWPFGQHLNSMTETIKIGIFFLWVYCSVKLPLPEKIIKGKSEAPSNSSPWYQELALSRGGLRKRVPIQMELSGESTSTATEVPKWAVKLVGLKSAYDKWRQCNTPYSWEHDTAAWHSDFLVPAGRDRERIES